ncbi:unnamed protein product [Brassicogethes aeneus]|uniref:Uncharacterized protein n=1 Tax=Brassicogethes aeneus TaxID=1431903 RepID=A0A9P0BBW2_BRAAE|nr:unnamed protein product [Brassicogethes aeneus]
MITAGKFSRLDFDDYGDSFDKNLERNVSRTAGEAPRNNLFNANFLEPLRHRKLMSASGILSTLNVLREPIADYQSSRGIARNETITFMNLITSLISQAYTAGLTILVMLWNLLPLVEGFVYLIRFILDKLIDILETEEPKDKVMKTIIFCGELFLILIVIFLIVGLIFMPVYVLTAKLFGKLWGMIVW